MSRIGKLPVTVPESVKIELVGQEIKVKGKHGELEYAIPDEIKVSMNENAIIVEKKVETRIARQKYGLVRALINNMVIGVSQGFSKELEIIGVGYQAQSQGQRLQLQLGYSHEIIFDLPEGITVTANRTEVKIDGIDKQLVGAVAAKIRSFRPPEPYKGKGIRYKDEYVRSKQGKTVGAK